MNINNCNNHNNIEMYNNLNNSTINNNNNINNNNISINNNTNLNTITNTNSNSNTNNNNNINNVNNDSSSSSNQCSTNGLMAAGPEKPIHYTYLKGFRVEQCNLFLQHKCTNHKPYICFDWHFQNQRRRRPLRKRDGTFNYSPDTYCTKYDETTGLCPDKDECPFLHKTAGDTERRYHLRYYKTGICVYETDSRGFCTKNGKHCAFAHGSQDLRNPVYDIREVQSMENGNLSGDSDNDPIASGTNGIGSLERERNAILEDARWNETAYVLVNYKTTLCKRPPRFCRQGYACPQYHNGKDRRRSPKLFKYRSTPCPNTKQGDEWVDPSRCEQGDQCPYCHSRTEQQFHPEIFKSTKCKDIQDTGYCPRGAFCAFAHNEDEMSSTRDINLDNVESENPSESSPICQSFNDDNLDILLNSSSLVGNTTNGISRANINDDVIEHKLSLDRISFNDEEDIFKCDKSSTTNEDTIINNCIIGIQPVIRPRSISTSANFNLFPSSGIDLRGGSILQEQQQQNNFNRSPTLQAALARARLLDEFRNNEPLLPQQNHQVSTNNTIGFRERAAHTFSIPTSSDFITQHQQQIQLQQQLQQQQQNQEQQPLEKPLHYTYLKGFRVEQCILFLQHKCTNHKPYTCFDWHFQNQRRRKPIRKRDGTFNYSPDTYCTKYDETTGLCPDKDECQFLHKTAGDTERRYHLRYYKTGICVYETDSRGFCTKNGKHCAFAHGSQDLRNPIYDIREVQSMANGNLSGDSNNDLTGGIGIACTNGIGSLERERNAILEDARWNETAYVLVNYKTTLCKRPPRFCRQGYACPQYHNGKDRRRSPKLFKYRSTPCPNTKQGDEWVDPSRCEQGDQCPYCHSRTEQQFHPEIFKSSKCKDIQDTGYCPRGAFCAFAHNEDEMSSTRDINLDNVETENPSESSPTCQSFNDNNLENLLNSSSLVGPTANGLSARQANINNVDVDHKLSLDRLSSFNDEEDIFKCDKSSGNEDTLINNCLLTGIQPVIRPRSISTSANFNLFPSSGLDLRGGSILQDNFSRSPTMQAALARARLVDEFREISQQQQQQQQQQQLQQRQQLQNHHHQASSTNNTIGFRERSAHTFSIPTSSDFIAQHQQQIQRQQLQQQQQQLLQQQQLQKQAALFNDLPKTALDYLPHSSNSRLNKIDPWSSNPIDQNNIDASDELQIAFDKL